MPRTNVSLPARPGGTALWSDKERTCGRIWNEGGSRWGCWILATGAGSFRRRWPRWTSSFAWRSPAGSRPIGSRSCTATRPGGHPLHEVLRRRRRRPRLRRSAIAGPRRGGGAAPSRAQYCLIGGRSLGIDTTVIDPAQWLAEFGIDVDHVDQMELVRRAEAMIASDPRLDEALAYLEQTIGCIHWTAPDATFRLTRDLLRRCKNRNSAKSLTRINLTSVAETGSSHDPRNLKIANPVSKRDEFRTQR
jgi:L-fucose isomerase, second N-terminal domain